MTLLNLLIIPSIGINRSQFTIIRTFLELIKYLYSFTHEKRAFRKLGKPHTFKQYSNYSIIVATRPECISLFMHYPALSLKLAYLLGFIHALLCTYMHYQPQIRCKSVAKLLFCCKVCESSFRTLS